MRVTYTDIKEICHGRDASEIRRESLTTIESIQARPFSLADSATFWYASATFWHAVCRDALNSGDLVKAWRASKSRSYAIKQTNIGLSQGAR